MWSLLFLKRYATLVVVAAGYIGSAVGATAAVGAIATTKCAATIDADVAATTGVAEATASYGFKLKFPAICGPVTVGVAGATVANATSKATSASHTCVNRRMIIEGTINERIKCDDVFGLHDTLSY